MSKYKKGQSGNIKGRPRGSKNKSTAELKKRTARLLDAALETFESDLLALEPKERVSTVLKLLEFHQPKLKAIEGTYSLKELSDSEVESLIEKILQSHE